MHNKLASTIVLLISAGSCLVSCQFLPQSHLGRLVQSITSPLVLSSGGYRDTDSDSYSDPSSYYSGAGSGPSDEQGSGPSPHSATQTRQVSRHQQQLQQAPSQQRGIPQRYNSYRGDEDRDQGSAPSTNKEQEYQMGAYLGPTMDDKELNGAFNSNDDRDDDDGPASYDGSSGPSGGRSQAASSAYGSGSGGEGYGPSSVSGYERQPSSASAGNYGAGGHGPSGYDEDSADEDDMPTGRGRRGRYSGRSGGLSQAASQYQQQQGGPQMVAAANGYAPYGYSSGPVDLTGILAGANGDPNSGYQAYNGDGSYPGSNYYQQQQQQPSSSLRQRSRNQMASMNQPGYYGQQQGDQRANRDNDDRDDIDED